MTTTDNETIEQLANREYKYGFVTEIEQDALPAGLSELDRRPHLGAQTGAGVDAGVAAQGLPPLADARRAALGERQVAADRLPVDLSTTPPRGR